MPMSSVWTVRHCQSCFIKLLKFRLPLSYSVRRSPYPSISLTISRSLSFFSSSSLSLLSSLFLSPFFSISLPLYPYPSLSPTVSLPPNVSLSSSISLYIYHSLLLYLFASLSPYSSLSLSISLSPSLSLPLSLSLSGMSFSKRQSKWANSALVVSVTPDDMKVRQTVDRQMDNFYVKRCN